MSPRPNHLPVWQDFHDTVELADSELVGARFQFTYHCRGALKKHVASFDGIALLTGCQWGNSDHTVILVPIDLKRINMRPGCTDPIHVVREFWIPDSSFPDGYRNRVVEEDLFPEPNTPSTYSTVVINALRGLSAYDLYVQQGGNLPLQQWLQIGGYSQEVMQTINNLVTNLRETLGLDIAQAIQTAHQAMVDAADRAAAQAQASAQSAQQAADSVQQAADLATEQATAQAQAAAQSAQTSAQSAQQAADSVQQAADLASEQATAQAQAAAQSAQTATAEAQAAQAQAEASQQAADAAAADLAEARAKAAQILAAIDALDPSQSTSDAIVAEAAARSAKDAELEADLADLEQKIDLIDQFPTIVKMKILECFRAVAWASSSGGTLVDELEALFGRHGSLISISCTYTPSKTIYPYDSLDDIKSDLVVEAIYQDNTRVEIPSYTLAGVLSIGTQTITVEYNGLTTTFNVNVSDFPSTLSLTAGDLTKHAAPYGLQSNGSIGFGEPGGNHRRVFTVPKGITLPITSYESNGQSSYIPLCYPIPVPRSATRYSVSVSPSTMGVACALYTYNSANHTYTLIDGTGSGWQIGTATVDFSAGEYYLTTVARYNDTSGQFVNEPTELTINFS